MAVNVTENAAREIATIIKQQELDPAKVCLRVGVKGGGCSGFSYILDLTENKKDSDEEWVYSFASSNGKADQAAEAEAEGGDTAVAVQQADGEYSVRVICDPKSYLYLNGTTVDFKDEIMGRGFVFNNPNATNTCGCGSSFSA